MVRRNRTVGAIVSGGAIGADTIAEKFAKRAKIPTKIIKPEWEIHGRKAAFVRNCEIVDASDWIIAFWDGVSAGTRQTIMYAQKQGKKTWIFYPDGKWTKVHAASLQLATG